LLDQAGVVAVTRRFIIAIAGLALLLTVGLAAFAQKPAASAASTSGASRSGPLVLDGVDTTDVREIDLDGLKKLLQRDPKDTRPLLVNFWATWCDGCREEFPDLVKIDDDYRAKGLNFVAVSLDEVADVDTKVVPFLKSMKASMRVVLLNVKDPDPAIHFVDANWQGDMPATFLYDREGKIVFKHFGKINPDELRAAIDKEVSRKQ
jgi:thiol-disulfide isomerase/thioredoxin